jgi:hypothetical protein
VPVNRARGFGWRPDDPLDVQLQIGLQHATALVGVGARDIPAAADYRSLMDGIPDQKGSSSCTGQALATSCLLTSKFAGQPIPRPSPKVLYDFGRLEDAPGGPLQDVGARPMAVIRGGAERGLVSEADWPILFDESGRPLNINEPPPLDVYQSALAAKIGSYYRIAPGPGASLLCRVALARGFFPMFAMPVDDVYLDWSSDAVYPGRRHASEGGHMQALCGYGDGFLLIMTSWGETHGDHGVVKISSDYFDSGEATDIIVATVVPRVLAA